MRIAARGQRWNRSETISGYLFILPGIIGLTIFVVYPLIASAYYALTSWNGAADPIFVGFKNFVYMFTQDLSFWPSLTATAIFALLSVPSSLVLGLLLALLLNRSLPGIRLFRTLLYLPAVLPSIATLTLWKFIYNPDVGLANQVLKTLGLPGSMWLGSYEMALPALVIVGLWGVGTTMIIFLAGQQAVPPDLYEAARLDGAGTLSVFLRMTLPLIIHILFLQLVMGLISALQELNQAAVLTQGGPGFTTTLFMYSIYTNAFQNQSLGYAVAQVWVLFAIIIVLTFLTFRFSRMWVYADGATE